MSVNHIIVRRNSADHKPENSSLDGSLHPVLSRVYQNRGVTSLNDLELSLEKLLSPASLLNVTDAARLLEQCIRQHQRILILADYDADGATSCALAMRVLRSMGAEDVTYVVPDRFVYGYGLTAEIVDLIAQHHPTVVLTVDNGIASHAGVDEAKRRGIKVIISDHHLPGQVLPSADAIVNPNLPDDPFASKNLAGVGVVFYLLMVLRSRLRESKWFNECGIEEPNLARYLDLVALGTVADVVSLDRNNRILVAQGLARINQGKGCPGIQALLKLAGRGIGKLTASDLGFVVGPRINAAGRLSDMSLGIECLLTDDAETATGMARELDRLNRDRRERQAEMQQQAERILEHMDFTESRVPPAICLYEESWHQGIIGLIASRLKEQWHRPVVAFAPGEGDELKGSARSITGIHIRDALEAVATSEPGLLTRFGGHAMAAGLSLPRAHYPQFKQCFESTVAALLTDDDLLNKIWSDGELSADDLSLDLAEALRAGGPWGQGFPEPVFDGVFTVVKQRVVGINHLKMILSHQDKHVDAIAFNADAIHTQSNYHQVHAAYKLDVNEYQGTRSLQLVIEHLQSI